MRQKFSKENVLKLQLDLQSLRKFSAIDVRMQLGTMMTFLEIAKAHITEETLNIHDLPARTGINAGSMTRHVHYWAGGHKQVSKAMEFITVEIDPDDMRRRNIALTQKGEAFLYSILEG